MRRGMPREYSSGRLKKNSSSSGMTSVSPTCSPLRSSSRNSRAVCAASMRVPEAAPGAGAKVSGAGVVEAVMCVAPVR